MRLSRLIPTVTAALAVLPSAAAATPPPGKAEVRLVACHHAERPAYRRLEVEGEMRAAAAGEGLRMRFDLYRRLGARRPFTRVPGHGLGIFYRAGSGAGAYEFRKAVRNLPAADYRMVVTFEWVAGDGSVRKRMARSAPVCRQPELRPDLQLRSLRCPAAQPSGRL